jgi:predicted permease
MRVTSVPEGRVADPAKPINLNLSPVAPDYFRTIGVTLLRGRDFTSRDTAASPRVVIVNEALVKTYWPGQDALGKHIELGAPAPVGEPQVRLEVVGVVRDAKYRTITEEPTPTMFVPLEQDFSRSVVLLVRSAQPSALVETVRSEVRRMDAMMPVYGVRTLAEQRTRSLANPRMAAALLSLFGSLGLLLGVIGLYGVMAYVVAQRTREIGIRMALGARRGEIFGLVVGQGMGMVLVGLLLGAAGSLATTNLIAGLLVGVQPHDPSTIGLVVALLSLAALAACILPARRATHVDPTVALRQE